MTPNPLRTFARLSPVVALLVPLLAAGTAPPAPGSATPGPAIAAPGSPDSVAAAIDALRRETQRAELEEDPFEGGPAPDLVVLSTTDVHGEMAPCG